MNKEILTKELTFKAIRSSGAGGQHVNKVSSKVVLTFDVMESEGINDREKLQVCKSLVSRLTIDKVLLLSCDDSRSQLQNKNRVIERFFEVMKVALFVPKRRLKAKPSKASIKRVKDKKKNRGELKKSRQKPSY